MRLLNIVTNAVEEHDFANAPPYAAISYLWPAAAAAAAPDAATRKEQQQQQVVVPWSSAALITAARDSSSSGAHLSTVPFSSAWPGQFPAVPPAALNDALAAIYAGRAAVLDADDGQPKQPAASRPAPHFTHLILCIPQDSDAHKAAEEVAMMSAYYSRAACVWVFLDVLGKPALPLNPQGAVVARWFTRLWTLQECVLPSKLFFLVPAGTKTQAEGTATVTTRLVTTSNGSTAALHVNAESGIASDPLQGGHHQFRVALQLLPLPVRNASVRTALLLSSVRECSYPVDRLYGILGLLPRDRPDVFDADKSLPSTLGPAVVKSVSLVSLAPLEHDDDEEGTDAPRAKSDATATATTTTSANTLSWFGGFQPGLFVAGGTRLLRTNREHEEFLSKDEFSADTRPAARSPTRSPSATPPPRPPDEPARP
ncbi:hypothetical protein DFJ73DRAFT_929320 [Zopfochytrium polystomum]|nr:hypothetical protein DFJ73DRAFT_929320 [Zopfochytrium polystomum]